MCGHPSRTDARSLRPRHNPESDGFTLLEVALCVAIIAIVLAVSYPSISRGSAAFRLRATGRDIVNTMRYAREKAVTEQQEMRVAVYRDGQKIMLTDELGEGARVFVLPKEIRIERLSLAGEEIREDPLVIRFLPNGSAESAEIQIASDKGAQLKVVSDAITGGARLMLLSEVAAP